MFLGMLTKIAAHFKEYTPKSVICLREGYTKDILLSDLFAGIAVGIISLPLVMAFAIASGVSPERGLFTAVVAGVLISALGGSRVQIAGPTGAFVVIVFSVVEKHGYDGLCLATILAGIMLILLALVRAGVLLKFISHSVTTGFTSGIALVIFTSQLKDLLGLQIETAPVGFLEKWTVYGKTFQTANQWALLIGLFSLALIFLFARFVPKIPGAIIAVILSAIAVSFFDLPIETVKSKFGEIPRMLPTPSFPEISLAKIQAVFPDAVTIALLGAIESLLSAVVADGMTGNRHRSNCELLAQGIANLFSIFFGGIPATGAVARTSTNIRMGAKTPLSGIINALTILALMVFFAPWAALIPLPALAAVLIYVAWNMSELENVASILKGPKSDAIVLMVSFMLTVLIDLTVAVEVGVILSCILFLQKMSDTSAIKACKDLIEQEEKAALTDSNLVYKDIPDYITVFELDGPLFFATASSLGEPLHQMKTLPKVFILRMGRTTIIDASGIHALKQFDKRCRQKQILFLLSEVNHDMSKFLNKTGVAKAIGQNHIFESLPQAVTLAKTTQKAKAAGLELQPT